MTTTAILALNLGLSVLVLAVLAAFMSLPFLFEQRRPRRSERTHSRIPVEAQALAARYEV
jgi:uncharacterized membrane protein affecting hemolysin expression